MLVFKQSGFTFKKKKKKKKRKKKDKVLCVDASLDFISKVVLINIQS
jgi:hypothetical protein